jgi:hypothetical protein
MIVADASEPPQGEPLFVKLVDQGRIVYRESFEEQADRADRTWGRYRRFELSPKIGDYMERFRAMREREVAAARTRIGKEDEPQRHRDTEKKEEKPLRKPGNQE